MMEMGTIWWILAAVAAILLAIYFFNGRNAIWGGMTSGLLIGAAVAAFFMVRGDGFDLSLIGKGAVVGTLVGFVAELIGRAPPRLRT